MKIKWAKARRTKGLQQKINLITIPWKKKKNNVSEKNFQETKAENVINLAKTPTDTKGWVNTKRVSPEKYTPINIIMKLLKTKDKDKILK
jgi:hypothetical protein